MAHVLSLAGKTLLALVISLVALPVGLLVLVFGLLAVPPLRSLAVEQGLGYANQSLDGMKVEVKSLDRIDPWGINLRGVKLFDEQKREMVHVPWLMVRIDPLRLVHNTLALSRVEVDGTRVHLYPSDEPEKEEPEEPAAEPSTFTVRVEHVRIRDAELVTAFDGRTLRARVGTLAAGGQWGPKPALALKQALVRASADDAQLLMLRTTRDTAWDAARGGHVGVEATLVNAPLTLEAELPPLDQLAPWPVQSAKLTLRNVTRRTLALLGVPDGAELRVPLDLTLVAGSSGPRLTATLDVDAGELDLQLVASADDRAYEAKLAVKPAQLKNVAGLLPDMKVGGNVHALAWPTQTASGVPSKVKLLWRDVAIDGSSVPGGRIHAELPLPIVRLKSLTLAGMEKALAAEGELDTERMRGRAKLDFAQFRLEAIALLAQLGMAGTLDGGLAVKFGGDLLDGDGKLNLRGFRHPQASLAELDLGFDLSGKPTSPEGDFNLRISQLVAGRVRIDQLTSEAHATPDKLTGRTLVRGPDTLLNVELGGQRRQNGDMRAQAIGRGKLLKRELRFDLRELLYGENGVTVQKLALFSGKQGVMITGSLDRREQVEAQVSLSNIDLRELGKLAGAEQLRGSLAGVVQLAGTLDEPRVGATLELDDARYLSKLPVDAKLELKADLATRKAELKLAMHSDEELGARANIAVSLPKRPADLALAAKDAHVKADLKAWLPMDQISAMAGDQLAGLEGNLEATVTAEGTLEAPHLDADVRASLKLPEQKGEPVEGVRLTAKIDPKQAKVDLWSKDEEGELLTFDGFVEWPGGNPRAALEQPTVWKNARFVTRAELKPRRLDTMQGVFAYFTKIYALSLPLRTTGKLAFQGDRGALEGDANFKVTIYGDKLDGRCKLGAQSSADISARLKQDKLELELGAITDGGGKLNAKLSSALELNALDKEEEPVVGPARLELTGKEIAIHKLPGLCNLQGGVAFFEATAEGLGKQRPSLALNATIRDLHAADQPAMRVDLKALAKDELAKLTGELKTQQGSLGTLGASVPLSYEKGSTTPIIRPDAPIDAHVKLKKLPLANVLALTEALGRVSGKADIDLTVTGPVKDPYPEGSIGLEDVNLSVASIAQPFRNVNGRIEIKGRSVNIPKLVARDRDGKLTLQGFATFNADMTGNGGLYIEADEFPLRQQGTVIGELTTRARIDAKIPADLKAQAELKILDGRIWLTGDRGKNVQSLDPHPDVRFADEKVEQESTPAEEKAEAQQGQAHSLALGSFRMKTEKELWLMHKDFGLQVGVDLAILEGEAGLKMEGEATLVRGELKLLGKPFKLDKGAIRFTGDMPPDPELDIKAVFSPPSGEDLVVQVSGRGSAPVLEFSGAATTAGEAVAVLTGVGGGSASNRQSQSGAENDAASQMAGVAADMTAGLLVMTARREFGDWVPMVSIETGESGQPTSARAGFDASKLIPPWLEGFAQGAYVEGIVGSSAESGGSVGVGVKLEVALPRDVITSLGYGPGPGWSTDVAWAP